LSDSRHKFDGNGSIGRDFLGGKCEPFRIVQADTISDIVQYQLKARVFLAMYLLEHDVTQLQRHPDRGLESVFLFFLENLLADVFTIRILANDVTSVLRIFFATFKTSLEGLDGW
jgi:hypothetical protein